MPMNVEKMRILIELQYGLYTIKGVLNDVVELGKKNYLVLESAKYRFILRLNTVIVNRITCSTLDESGAVDASFMYQTANQINGILHAVREGSVQPDVSILAYSVITKRDRNTLEPERVDIDTFVNKLIGKNDDITTICQDTVKSESQKSHSETYNNFTRNQTVNSWSKAPTFLGAKHVFEVVKDYATNRKRIGYATAKCSSKGLEGAT